MAEDTPLNTESEPEGWQEAVWRAYCKGNRRTGPLCKVSEANGGPAKWDTVNNFLARQKKALLIDRLAEEDRVDYEAGLESDLEDADAIYNRAVGEGNTNGQIGALRAKMEARERIAASRGVVTQRKGEEHSGPGGKPIQVAWWDTLEAAQAKVKSEDPDGKTDSADA